MRKRIIAAAALMLLTVPVMAEAPAAFEGGVESLEGSLTEEEPFGPLAGGWAATEDEHVGEDAKAVFERAVESQEEVYEPVALLATQVVAGTNYCFLCRGETSYAGGVKAPAYFFLYIYEDLQGNAEVMDIQPVEFGMSVFG